MARFLAAKCRNDLKGDEARAERARAMIRTQEVDATSDCEEIRMLGSLGMFTGAPSEGLRLVEAWLKFHLGDLEAEASYVYALRMLGVPERALELANGLLKDYPEHARLRQARDAAANKPKELRDR